MAWNESEDMRSIRDQSRSRAIRSNNMSICICRLALDELQKLSNRVVGLRDEAGLSINRRSFHWRWRHQQMNRSLGSRLRRSVTIGIAKRQDRRCENVWPNGQSLSPSGIDLGCLIRCYFSGLCKRIDPNRGKLRQIVRQLPHPPLDGKDVRDSRQLQTLKFSDKFRRRFSAHCGLSKIVRKSLWIESAAPS